MNTLSSNNIQDPWEPLHARNEFQKHTLTSIELTVTHRCNMRCIHCAVGNGLELTDGEKLPLPVLLNKLDQVEELRTISITGGEPMLNQDTVDHYLIPILKYASSRGVKSQINSNLTLPYERYDKLLPYLDVMHISYNALDVGEFLKMGFGRSEKPKTEHIAEKLFVQLHENTQKLTANGMFISAETMINWRTQYIMPELHRAVVALGCQRHEIHPMYPSDFAADLPMLSKEQMKEAIESLLQYRDPETWILFGTLPFYACSHHEAERELIRRMQQTKNITVRNDPDGRNRLNINLFSGDIFVTDFASVPSLGNLLDHDLSDVYGKWQENPLFHSINCFCPQAACCGPNLLVKEMYYRNEDFTLKKAHL